MRNGKHVVEEVNTVTENTLLGQGERPRGQGAQLGAPGLNGEAGNSRHAQRTRRRDQSIEYAVTTSYESQAASIDQ